jgi:hypothetical protein
MTLRQEFLMTVRFNLQNFAHLRFVVFWGILGLVMSFVSGFVGEAIFGIPAGTMRLYGVGGYVALTTLCFAAIVAHDVAYHEISELEARRSAGIMTMHGPG